MLTIKDANQLNAQGKALGFKDGDLLIKMNGDSIPYNERFRELFQTQQRSLQEGQKISYTVLRKNETGALKPVDLSADAIIVEREVRHLLGWNQQATPGQLALRKSWIEKPE
jgi:hypothetical protein